jgi:hypothetical protein
MYQKKNGEKISVDLQSNPILYKGKNARIAVVSNITESQRYIHEIEVKNGRNILDAVPRYTGAFGHYPWATSFNTHSGRNQ